MRQLAPLHGDLDYRIVDGRVESVIHADSSICIADEVLYDLAQNDPRADTGFRLLNSNGAQDWYPIASHHGDHLCEPLGREPDFCFTGCWLIVEPTRGDKLIYLIDQYGYCENAWHARWPD